MYRLSIEEYKSLLKSYQESFSMYFPDLKMECLETTFSINEQDLQYTDITGILITDVHLLVEMGNSCRIHLPISENANHQLLFNL